jgi:hypothetical protein
LRETLIRNRNRTLQEIRNHKILESLNKLFIILLF